MIDFTGKVFMVTGASSGIGKSCAEQIITLGGRVIGVDKNESTINNTSYEHSVIGVTDENAVENLVKTVSDKYGHIDGLVNAAGIWGSCKPFYSGEP